MYLRFTTADLEQLSTVLSGCVTVPVHGEKTDRGRGRNHPPLPRQLMSVWGKKRTENRSKKKKKKQGAGPQPSYLNHSVASCDPHRSYGGPILKHPTHMGENIYHSQFYLHFKLNLIS